jgi:hypothetical protein
MKPKVGYLFKFGTCAKKSQPPLFYSVAVLPGDFLALQTSAELSVVNTGVIRRSSPPFFFDDPTPLAEEKC